MNALVVFASLTGNTEEIADLLVEELENLGVNTEIEECTSVGPEDFEDVDICVVATYTYGTDANLPDEIVDFYEELEEIDLSGKAYGTAGSGDHFYEKFCQSVLDFDEQFKKTGATRAGEPVLVDLSVEEEDEEEIKRLASELVETAKSL